MALAAASCDNSSTTCNVTATPGDQTVTATFSISTGNSAVDRIISINKIGTGSGTVSGTSNGTSGSLNCGASCSSVFTQTSGGNDPTVTLIAVANTGSVFTGWKGIAGGVDTAQTCKANTTCLVPASAGTNTITANFDLGSGSTSSVDPVIAVNKTGAGSGNVTATTNGTSGSFNCGTSCSSVFSPTTSGQNATVTLTATPNTGSVFTGWSGAAAATCGSNTTCLVTATAGVTTVSANFALSGGSSSVAAVITANKAGNGTGTITATSNGASGGFVCGTACSGVFQQTPDGQNATVTLTVVADSGFVFAGWSGVASSCGTNTTCNITATPGPQTVTATFSTPTAGVVSVNTVGTGSGSITSTTTGTSGAINCGSNCTSTFAPPQVAKMRVSRSRQPRTQAQPFWAGVTRAQLVGRAPPAP